MQNYLELGPVPADENCEQLGPNYDVNKARRECNIFRGQLRRMFGPEPFGASLVVRGNQHEYGTYYEVAVKYNDEDEEAVDYAFRVENEYPANWDDEALTQLKKKEPV